MLRVHQHKAHEPVKEILKIRFKSLNFFLLASSCKVLEILNFVEIELLL